METHASESATPVLPQQAGATPTLQSALTHPPQIAGALPAAEAVIPTPPAQKAKAAPTAPVLRRRGFGWYATFILLTVVVCVVIYYFTGQDALGATTRFLWNIVAVASEGIASMLGGIVGVIARGIGWRRLSRLSAAIAGVGLGYAGGVVMSDRKLHQARGWRDKLFAAVHVAGSYWNRLPLYIKLLAVVVLIMSQVYLHTVIILFPIAFMVPFVRMIWVRAADVVFHKWYWKRFGKTHRSLVARLRRMPISRSVIGGTRLLRIRYLCAWRIWRYSPCYRKPESSHRRVSLVEPIRLWRRGDLDRYVGHPLLRSGKHSDKKG